MSGRPVDCAEERASACPCGDLSHRLRFVPPPYEYTVVSCLSCGLWRTHPRPTVRALEMAYADDYPAHQPSAPATHGSGWRRVWVLPPVPHGSRVLELGGGTGRFAEWAARERAWQVTSVEGVGGAETFDYRPREYDAVVAWQVLEHTLDPLAVLRRAFDATRANGALCVSVPNVASVERWLWGASWSGWQLPFHLWHFSPRTLRALVEEAGWDVHYIVHQRVFKGIRPPWLANVCGAAAAAMRLGGRITLVATRPA